MENIDSNVEPKFGSNVVSYAVIFANVFGCIIVLFQMRLLSMTHLHKNCTFLLNGWSVAFLVQFASQIVIYFLNCNMNRKIRLVLHSFTQCAQLLSTSFELSVTIERIISSIRPEKYYRKKMARRKLYSLVVLIGLVTIIQEQLSKAGHHVACLIAIITLDIFTIIMNSIAVRYCGRKFEQLQGKTTLNARYQVKEARDIANAMQPVYIGSFIFKNLIFIVIFGSCYKVSSSYDCVPLWFSLPFEYLELIYVLGFTAASITISICFMLMHPRLRRKTAILRQKFWGVPITITSQSEVTRIQANKTEGDIYFEKLTSSWNIKMRR